MWLSSAASVSSLPSSASFSADDKREKAASAKKDAEEGKEDGGTRAGGDDVVDPDADAILGPGILEPVEDRAKASTAA